MSSKILDVKGLQCPLPVLRAKRALRDVAVDEILEVLATDPNSVKDMDTFCRQTGNELIGWSESDGTFSFQIKRRT